MLILIQKILGTTIWKLLVKCRFLKKPSIQYCIDNKLLPSIITLMPSHLLRETLLLPYHPHITQLNQDVFALLINKFQPGFFIEIGANDGLTLSNTAYLEFEFGWRGILIEANPKYLSSLETRMNSIVINKAVSQHEGIATFVDADLYGGLEETLDIKHSQYTIKAARISVECAPLEKLLDHAQAPGRIDFISIDIEGGELAILKEIATSQRRFSCGCIEHNHREDDYSEMVNLLKSAGYQIVWSGQTGYDLFFIDTRK